MATPWYDYPMDSPGFGYGFIEPQCPGCYKKPDTNIRVPSGTPITALLSGVITSAQDLGWNAGGLSVTERLDNPINNEAQYVSYNFLGSTNAWVGERVGPGTQIGTAGSSYGIFQAVGLGEDPTWGRGKFLSGTGDPLLNPETQLLDKVRSGQSIPNIGSTGLANYSSSGSSNSNCPWYCSLTPFSTIGPCSGCSAANTGSGQANQALQNLNTGLGDLVDPAWWARVGIILLGGILIAIGVMKLLK